jgi:hypothetical protein
MQLRNQTRNDMAASLNVDSWVIFKSSNDEEQPFWLGRTVSNTEWGNACIWLNDTRRNKTFYADTTAPVLIKPNSYAINVQWYTQKTIGVLEYIVEGGDNAIPFIQSNSGLLLVVPEEHIIRVLGQNVRVSRRRTVRSNQMDDFEYATRQSLQTSEGEWYRREFHNTWKLNECVQELAMEQVGQWQE